jgi:hypothetical protein
MYSVMKERSLRSGRADARRWRRGTYSGGGGGGAWTISAEPRWEGEGGLNPSAGAQPRPDVLVKAYGQFAFNFAWLAADEAMGLGDFSTAEAGGGGPLRPPKKRAYRIPTPPPLQTAGSRYP